MRSQKNGRRAPGAKTDSSRLRSRPAKVTGYDLWSMESAITIAGLGVWRHVAYCRSPPSSDKILTVSGRQWMAVWQGNGGKISPPVVGSASEDRQLIAVLNDFNDLTYCK